MALTKPAGVGMQLIGAIFFLPGLVILLGDFTSIGGYIVTAIGVLLLSAGRQPSKNEVVAAHPANSPASEFNSPDPPKEPERVENFVTAKNGQLTYRVIAYRRMDERELRQVVFEALQSGKLKEPEPGGTVTLVTDIGEVWPKRESD